MTALYLTISVRDLSIGDEASAGVAGGGQGGDGSAVHGGGAAIALPLHAGKARRRHRTGEGTGEGTP